MAASSFETAIRYVLAHEGGYTNHPSDPGGPTNWGITLHDARAYWKRNASAFDVRQMPLDVAKRIYRERYWNALRCDELPPGVDYALFDYGVNSGISRARKVLARIVAVRMPGSHVSDIVSAAGQIAAERLIRDLCAERRAFLRGLKTWPVFGRGWGRRVAEVEANALALSRGSRENPMRVSAPAKRPGDVQRPVQGRGEIPASPHAQAAGAGAAISIGLGAALFASNWVWILTSIAGGILSALIVFLALRFYRAWRQQRVATIHLAWNRVMDWNDVARQVIARGAPVLGAALGGPLGGAAGAILAEALGGVPSSPNDLHEAINAPKTPAPDTAFAQAEKKWIDLLRAQAEEARIAIEQSHDTIRQEMLSGDVLQRWWRPIYAFELTLECALLWSAIVRGLWLNDARALNALIGATALLVAYWAFRFGVLGVYVHGRTQEKLREAVGIVAGARPIGSAARK